MRRLAALASAAVLTAGGLTACSDDGGDDPGTTVTATPQSADPVRDVRDAVVERLPDQDTTPPKVVDTIATGLAAPWGIGFLPNGDAIVTERDTTKVLLLTSPSYDVTRGRHHLGRRRASVTRAARPGCSASPCPPTSRPTGCCSSTSAPTTTTGSSRPP